MTITEVKKVPKIFDFLENTSDRHKPNSPTGKKKTSKPITVTGLSYHCVILNFSIDVIIGVNVIKIGEHLNCFSLLRRFIVF